MTTFKSQSTTVPKKEFISIKAENESEINQIHNFSEKDASGPKTFVGGVLASKSNKQNKKDLVASDNFYSNNILSSKKQKTKETPTQSAEPTAEQDAESQLKAAKEEGLKEGLEKGKEEGLEKPVEETKETPTQSAENPEVTEEGKNNNGV